MGLVELFWVHFPSPSDLVHLAVFCFVFLKKLREGVSPRIAG